MAPIATHPRLRVRQEDPLNAEPEPGALIESFRTPNELFFIRGHGNIPAVDAGAFRLEIDGLVESPLSLSLADLRRLPRMTAGATLQFAGNRRRELMDVSPIPHEHPCDPEAVHSPDA